MSMPYYVSPEQVMKDRADYARKGIARGRALVGAIYADGVAIVAENPSNTLRKVSEIYDRIAFGGVGRYNEFDQLRVAGVRAADLKGYQYSRHDVDARSLANNYAQILGQIFTHEMKPMEIEILVAEVGRTGMPEQLFHILYDGTVMDEKRFSVLGGDADAITGRMNSTWTAGASLKATLSTVTAALGGPERSLKAEDLEVALLTRLNGRRCFQRLTDEQVALLLLAEPAAESPATDELGLESGSPTESGDTSESSESTEAAEPTPSSGPVELAGDEHSDSPPISEADPI